VSIPVRFASAFSLALTLTFAVFGTSGAKARPQDPQMQVAEAPTLAPQAAPAVPGDIPVQPLHDAVIDPATATEADIASFPAASLPELVDMIPLPVNLSADIECLAGAVYFEAKSESLAGQLAVGRVIVARTESGRFPSSYCGVVMQHAQFSFVRGGTMPGIDRSSHTWHQAVKIALIAHHGAWKSPAEGALFFHAARVGPVSGKTRVARIDNHVFYR
jgi:spore germination cell wall hydrolase CwlJ-like protein